MKKLTYTIFAILLFGCSNELELLTEQKIEPIITSLIDLYSPDHYVRIQKTYQEFNENVYDVSSTDSYFQNVRVELFGIRNEDTIWCREFKEIIFDKDSGNFPNLKHRVYYYHGLLNLHDANGYIDNLALKVVTLQSPYESNALTGVLKPLKVSLNGGRSKRIQLYGDYRSIISLDTRRTRDGLRFFSYKELTFNFIVREIYKDSSRIDTISSSTNTGWEVPYGGYVLTPERIFNRLCMNLENKNHLLARRLLGIDLIGRIPDLDFEEMHLTSINRADLNNKPYTNYNYGYGIFVGFASDTLFNAVLDPRSMDSLVLSTKWKHLKFKTY